MKVQVSDSKVCIFEAIARMSSLTWLRIVIIKPDNKISIVVAVGNNPFIETVRNGKSTAREKKNSAKKYAGVCLRVTFGSSINDISLHWMMTEEILTDLCVEISLTETFSR